MSARLKYPGIPGTSPSLEDPRLRVPRLSRLRDQFSGQNCSQKPDIYKEIGGHD